MPDTARLGAPTPVGTGFFVSPDGLFVTARHVITDEAGQARTDLEQAWFLKEMRVDAPATAMCQRPELIFDDPATDIAVLRVDFDRNREKDWLAERSGFPFIEPSGRRLDEGEPVYAFGYPLPESDVQVSGGGAIGMHTLHPRVTSAIVSSTPEAFGPVQGSGEPVTYVLDKALNYGNSGGPIVATETGCVHAVCTRFQPVEIPQPHLRDASGGELRVWIPSLYGVVSSIGNPAVRTLLESEHVALTER